jgi:hypothetical protein
MAVLVKNSAEILLIEGKQAESRNEYFSQLQGLVHLQFKKSVAISSLLRQLMTRGV